MTHFLQNGTPPRGLLRAFFTLLATRASHEHPAGTADESDWHEFNYQSRGGFEWKPRIGQALAQMRIPSKWSSPIQSRCSFQFLAPGTFSGCGADHHPGSV
jgi:hypothetical protein